MADAEPRRSRRRWFPAFDEVPSPQSTSSTGPSPSKARPWARPQPPPAEQQGARPRVRQLNVRKAALPPEARPKEAVRNRETPLGQRRNSGKVQLKPQPPAAPYANSKNTGRIRSAGRQRTKDAVERSASPSKLDQDHSRKPEHHLAATKLASSRSIAPGEATTAGMGSAVKLRTPFSGASPFKQAAHRPGPSSQHDSSTSRAGLSRANSTRSRLLSLEDRQHSQAGQQRRIQSAASARVSATQQLLKAVLKVLQQQQKQQQTGYAMQVEPIAATPGEGQLRSSLVGIRATELLKAAHHRAAATAQDAIRDVLLTDRALHVQQQFEGLQQTAAAASLSAQQVDSINNFLAISNRVQQMIDCSTRRLQQQCQAQEPRLGSENTPQPAPVPQEQQQGQPVSSSERCRTQRAPTVLQELPASENDQQHRWSGNITTNLLFVSVPSSCYGVSSPTYAGASASAQTAAAQPPLQGDRSSSMDYWGDFQPLQHGLKTPKPASVQQKQQEAQEVQVQQEQQHQRCTSLHLLKNMQGEMLEWFAQYLEHDIDKIQPHSRAQCIGMLKAFSKAQDWAAQQLGDADSKCRATELTGITADLGSRQTLVCGLRQERSSTSMPEGIDGADLCCSGSSGGAGAPVVQLQQIQRALRKRMAHFGTLQHKLSS